MLCNDEGFEYRKSLVKVCKYDIIWIIKTCFHSDNDFFLTHVNVFLEK